jgi:predicted small secreted protein
MEEFHALPRRKPMRKLLTVLALSGTAMFMTACNTVDGAVEDVESVGDCADGVEGNC